MKSNFFSFIFGAMNFAENSSDTFSLLAKTFFGLEDVLAQELKEIGATNIRSFNRAVQFEADQSLMYRANLRLRTALRILRPIRKFEARTDQQLYRGIQSINWRKYLHNQNTFAIDSVVRSPFFNHSKYVALKCKDAIVDQFREKTGRRPSIDVFRPDLRLHIHIGKDQVSVYLDSSGDSLHKRGYRSPGHKAPLNEVLAAGMILLSGWKGEGNFVDPMCGSGTLLIEAAAIAGGIAPGLNNRDFGFLKWKDFDKEKWQDERMAAKAMRKDWTGKIVGADISGKNLSFARNHIALTGFGDQIRVTKADFRRFEPPKEGGIAMMNPPYGERLSLDDATAFYKGIGDRFKKAYQGYEAWMISSNKEGMKRVGLRPEKRYTLYNGPLECKFHHYSIYAGSRGDG